MIVLLYQALAISSFTLLWCLIKLLRAERLRWRPVAALDGEWPTVSVCIPARNETHAMTRCLEQVLASDYPKLEILVLDDDSSDDTSQLIRAFAHAGVRFLPGNPLPERWLGRNYALQSLLDEASGQYVLFVDVDTRLAPTTIRQLVADAAQRQLTMLSVIPQRRDLWRASAWFGSLRYFWDIVLHRPGRAPSAVSALWLVRRRELMQLGGLSAWRDEVQPERAVARELAVTGEYALVIATPQLGVSYEKKWRSQIEASRRQLLPRFGNATPNALLGMGLLGAVLLPQIVLVQALVSGWIPLYWWPFGIGLAAMLLCTLYARLVWTRRWWLAWLVAPYLAWQELIVLILSVIGYHRGSIVWKGRPVARPPVWDD